MKHSQKGFTLVELSIVLVIIGLVIGGVIFGRDLIFVAERRDLLSEWERVSTNVNAFKNKFGCLPGDCERANSFFAGSSAGNGDGMITGTASFTHPSLGWERCQFWYHLSEAGMAPGDEVFDICVSLEPVQNAAPKLKFNAPNTNYYVSAGCVSSNNCASASGYKNQHWILTHGTYNFSPSQYLSACGFTAQCEAPFTVEDVRWFDSKIDDGHALAGGLTLMTQLGTLSTDGVNSCSDSTAEDGYKNSVTERECHLRLKTNF